MTESLGCDADVHLVGGIEQKISAQKPEYGVERQRRGSAGRQDVQRRETLVNKDFVDNELKENRKSQTQRVKQDGCNRNVHKEPPFAQQIGNKPAESECLP